MCLYGICKCIVLCVQVCECFLGEERSPGTWENGEKNKRVFQKKYIGILCGMQKHLDGTCVPL